MDDVNSPRKHKFAPLPSHATAAARSFLTALYSDMNYFHFINDTVLTADWATYVAKQTLAGREYKSLDPVKLANSTPGNRTKILRKNSQLSLEMFLSRLVDNFQVYLVDLIRMVLKSCPSLLSTSEQTFNTEQLLKYNSIDDLIHYIIQRKVNSLSYDGFAKLYDWCFKRGIPIELSDDEREAIVELIATRNVIAHNRGFIDETYIRTVTNPHFSVNSMRSLDVDNLFDGLELLHNTVIKTDSAIIQKFSLSSAPLKISQQSNEITDEH